MRLLIAAEPAEAAPRTRRASAVLLAALALALLAAPVAGAVTVPLGFQARTLPIPRASEAPAPGYVNGIREPTTIAFAPDGKMFVGDWFGRVKVFDSAEDTTPTLAVDVAIEVHSFGDRGLLGMALDPQFGTSGHNYIYLNYAYDQAMGSATPPHAEYSDGGDNCKNESPYTDCLISGRVVRVALDPATGIAVGGATEPPQQELVRSWCQQFNSHSMGDLEFDATGALLVSGGEGANYAAADYGQFANPCGDPPYEGGSLRAQDVRTSADQTDYSGSVIRIDPETGAALPTNPLYASADERARRILAYGLRNPFRFEVRPGTSELYIADVGQNDWDELDRLMLPPTGTAALNFGWPCFEGGDGTNQVLSSWQELAEGGKAPLCQSLYATPSAVTASFYAYGHSNGNPAAGRLFAGDACDPSPGAAFSGLAFYDPTGIPAELAYPAAYQGALFMADAARGCVWVMAAGSDGKPDRSQIANFVTTDEAGGISPVDLVEGPDGALYAPNFYDDTIEQIRYVGANTPPTAAIEASKVDGPLEGGKFTVQFDASGSSDPEGDAFDYAWDLDGDGEFDDGSDQPTAEWTYESATNVVVKVRVSDEFGRDDIAAVTLYPGDLGPPTPVIEAPSPKLEWAIGDAIAYQGSATDPDDDDTLANGKLQLKWNITIQHCPAACHSHPYVEPEGPSGSLVAPPHEYPSHLRFELTATDSRGRAVTAARDIYPRVIEVALSSDPPGIPITFAGQPASEGPFKLIAGGSGSVSAPGTATIGGVSYAFSSWSDGGARTHEITSRQSLSLVAHYNAVAETVPPTPTPLRKVRIGLASRPPGIKLWAGRTRRAAPFAVTIAQGRSLNLRAPSSARRAGRRLELRGWLVKGRLRRVSSLRVVARGNARYVAIYGAG
jgi:glucose/arabinose dehydrogenase